MLNHVSILIADDEPIICMALTWAVCDAGGEVVGPAASVKAALELLETHSVSGAILDVNLTDGLVSPVVEYLMERNIPLIIQTGVGIPDELERRYPELVVRIKPNISDELIQELAKMIGQHQSSGPVTVPATGLVNSNDTSMNDPA